jgi:Flp pilus assembly protein TadG
MPRSPSATRKLLRRFRRNRRGSSAVEFALVAPMFIALMFAMLETASLFYATQMLEIGTQDTARLLFTNQAQGTMNAQQFHDNLCPRVSVLMTCANLFVDVKVFSSFSTIKDSDLADPIDGNGNFVNNFTYPTANPGDTVVVRAFYQWPIYVTKLGYDLSNMAGSKKLLKSIAAFQVEPGA